MSGRQQQQIGSDNISTSMGTRQTSTSQIVTPITIASPASLPSSRNNTPQHATATRTNLRDHIQPEVTHSSNPLHQLLRNTSLPQVPLPNHTTSSTQSQHQPQDMASFMNHFVTANRSSTPPITYPTPPPPPPLPTMMPRGFRGPPTSHGFYSPSPTISLSGGLTTSPNHTASVGNTVSPRANRNHTHVPEVDSQPPGTSIPEDTDYFTYESISQSGTTNSETNGQSQIQTLEVTPITIYKSERKPTQFGTLISVNTNYIAYPIRNGLIRVISQSSADRLLLRQHEHHTITELSFFQNHSDLLLSAGTDNKIAIYRIHTNESNAMTFEVLKCIPTASRKVKWHPQSSKQIAILKQKQVYVVNFQQFSGDTQQEIDIPALKSMSIVCDPGTEGLLHDMVFSPSGDTIITAGSAGMVYIFNLSDTSFGQVTRVSQVLTPFEGNSITSLLVFSTPNDDEVGLVVASEDNALLSLWACSKDGNEPLSSYQTIEIQSPMKEPRTPGPRYQLLFDQSGEYLFVADAQSLTLFVLHLQSHQITHNRRFDTITEFSVAYPILSMCALNRVLGRSAEGTSPLLSMQLYCLQTQAIQRYNVQSTQCYQPSNTNNITLSTLQQPHAIENDREMPAPPPLESQHRHHQTVGAMTNEGETMLNFGSDNVLTSPFHAQTASESANSTPETEVDGVVLGNNPMNNIRSLHANRRSAEDLENEVEVDENVTIDGEDNDEQENVTETAEAVQNTYGAYTRLSSPASSIRAQQDDTSVQYEPSLDGTISESPSVSQNNPSQSTTTGILMYLRKMEVHQAARDELLRDQMKYVMGNLGNHLTAQVAQQVEKSIQKQLQSVLVPAMGRIVLHTMEHNFMKPIQVGFQQAINDKLIPHIEEKLNRTLSTSLQHGISEGIADLKVNIVDDVRQPVRDSFRECFQDIIIPSFQAATQKMFEQINDTFVEGTANAISQNSTPQIEEILTLHSQVADLTSEVTQLKIKISSLTKAIAKNQGKIFKSNGTKEYSESESDNEEDSEEEKQLEVHRGSISQFLAAGKYEEAFQLALGVQNVQLVVYTCKHSDPRSILCVRPPKLSQMILLCLVQQLGADLAEELDLKLNWLREALLVMNTRDSAISGYVSTVLHELKTALVQVPESDRDSQFTLLHHILNSMLASL